VKLVLAVLHNKDADSCVTALNDAGFACTRLGSSGGFLDRGNATLLIGVDAAQVDKVIELIRGRAKRRNERFQAAATAGPAPSTAAPPPVDVEVGGATVFVLAIDRFERL
jgi:uncharacterized protein YaaQ